jgi:hypothetical protein
MGKPERTSFVVQVGREMFQVPICDSLPGMSPPREKVHPHSFIVEPNRLEFDCCEIGLSKTSQIELTNATKHPLHLKLQTSKPFVFGCENSVILPPRESVAVSIDFQPQETVEYDERLLIRERESQVVISLGGRGVEDIQSLSAMSSTEIRFPECRTGQIRRAQLRVSNRTRIVAKMKVRTTLPFLCPFPKFVVESMSYVFVPIRFLPMQVGDYEGTATFFSSTGKSVVIALAGSCIE